MRYWDLQTLELIGKTAADSTPTLKMAWRPDGEFLYACSAHNVRVMDLKNDQVMDIVVKPH